MTLLVAPTTSAQRAASIAALCTGFVYVVSRMGVTGADRQRGEMARSQVMRLRERTNKPLAVGFGVASPAQAAELASFADGVIVGSALVRADRGSSYKRGRCGGDTHILFRAVRGVPAGAEGRLTT